MYTQLKTFSFLAIAGTAIAAPQGWGNWGQGKWDGNWGGNKNSNNQPAATETAVAVVTAYTTVFQHGTKPTAAPEAPSAPAAPSAAPSAAPGDFYGKPSESAAAPPAASSAVPSPPSSSGGGYMDTVSAWRSKMGMSALTHDSKLEANALKTAVDGAGEMKHELNDGSMAQVLAPGDSSDFEKVFVGGWLCEVPSLPGLDGVCKTMSDGWSYEGQTGHADILSSPSYSKIGCALATGIWACDLA